MFDEHTWATISQIVAERLRYSISELDALRRNHTAKLIAALPYIAECRDADRTAAQHLITYLLARSAEKIFDHREADDRDLFARLERISHFPDGNKHLINRGMNLLALIMIAGYERDVQTDRARSVYNPIGSGSWNVAEIRARLVKQVRALPSPEMDHIVDLERALRGNW
ncbi:MAG TPA: hypothetical protein VJ932_00635 [Alkalispirochaeta sp.]|nr:hypothetical protein [Alkalispirochaeta sp.]